MTKPKRHAEMTVNTNTKTPATYPSNDSPPFYCYLTPAVITKPNTVVTIDCNFVRQLPLLYVCRYRQGEAQDLNMPVHVGRHKLWFSCPLRLLAPNLTDSFPSCCSIQQLYLEDVQGDTYFDITLVICNRARCDHNRVRSHILCFAT